MSLAEFAAEPELVLTHVVGHDVREHAGNIVTALGRGQSDLFEAANPNIRGAQDRLALDEGRITESQPVGSRVEAVIGVVEHLIEVVHAK